MFEFLFKYRPVFFERGTFEFGVSGWWYVVAIVAAVVIVPTALMYTRVRGKTRGPDRVLLSGIRIVLIAVVVFSLFRPVLVLSTVIPQRNFIGVLHDNSQSMRIADTDGIPRGQFIHDRFDPDMGDVLRALEERFMVRQFAFGGGAERIASTGELGFDRERTNLAAALDRARQDLSSVPLAGLVVISDGADNADASLTDAVLALQADGVPVHTVGLGREAFERDIELTRVETPRRVLRGTALAVEVYLSQRGYAGRTVPLVVEDAGRIVATQDVELAGDGEVTSARVHFTTDEPGPRRFRFRIPEQDGEMVVQNNRQEALVVVEDRVASVLYFEGEPRFEIGKLRRAVEDDGNLRLVTLVRTAENKFYRLGTEDENELVAGFPRRREELFDYRALILGSVDAGFFTHDQLRMIADFVGERGGGLVVLGGPHALAEGGYVGTPLEDVLPIVLRPAATEERYSAELHPVTTPAGLSHPVTQIAESEEASEERWRTMPAVLAVNEIRQVKPGATTLLRGEGGAGGTEGVILAVQRYGRGRVAALPIDNSWIWQMHADIPVDDLTHEKFWQQMLRWAVSNVPDRVTIRSSDERAAPGEPVRLIAEVEDDRYLRVNGSDVTATVRSPSGVESSLTMGWTVDRDGEYESVFVPDEIGAYEWTVTATEGGQFLESETGYFYVANLDREFYGAEQQRETLERIADETGGGYYTPAEVERLADEIQYTESGVTVIERRDLWNMPAIFLAIVILASAEWGYRRWRGLA